MSYYIFLKGTNSVEEKVEGYKCMIKILNEIFSDDIDDCFETVEIKQTITLRGGKVIEGYIHRGEEGQKIMGSCCIVDELPCYSATEVKLKDRREMDLFCHEVLNIR